MICITTTHVSGCRVSFELKYPTVSVVFSYKPTRWNTQPLQEAKEAGKMLKAGATFGPPKTHEKM